MVDLKRFERLIAEEENKPEVPYTTAPHDKPNTSHPLHNAKKVYTTTNTTTITTITTITATTTTTASTTTTAITTTAAAASASSRLKEKLTESSVDNSLPTVTDISTIDIDTTAGANDGNTVDSEDDMGSKVQASLKFEREQDGIKHNDDDALKSVLNLASQQQHHSENTKVSLYILFICCTSVLFIA